MQFDCRKSTPFISSGIHVSVVTFLDRRGAILVRAVSLLISQEIKKKVSFLYASVFKIAASCFTYILYSHSSLLFPRESNVHKKKKNKNSAVWSEKSDEKFMWCLILSSSSCNAQPKNKQKALLMQRRGWVQVSLGDDSLFTIHIVS